MKDYQRLTTVANKFSKPIQDALKLLKDGMEKHIQSNIDTAIAMILLHGKALRNTPEFQILDKLLLDSLIQYYKQN